jgi:subtilisin family serine protease
MIGLIDSGINFAHPEFAAKSGSVVSGWDFVDNDPVAFDELGGPATGHGTFIAGVMNLGAPGSQVRAYRVLDTLGRSDGFRIASAVLRAVDDGCRVINLSLGMQGVNDALDDALHYANDHDVIIVAAAGNDSSDIDVLDIFPAVRSYSIAVAAVDSLSIKADFSNYGGKVDLCGPGTQVYAPYTDTSYAWWDGTSFAAPFTAAVVAQMLALDPGLTHSGVSEILKETATDIDDINPQFEGELGNGMIDPVAALTFVQNLICGDIDIDGSVSIGDAVWLINYIFGGGEQPMSFTTADVDCSGSTSIGDAVYLINYIFAGGAVPCAGCQ